MYAVNKYYVLSLGAISAVSRAPPIAADLGPGGANDRARSTYHTGDQVQVQVQVRKTYRTVPYRHYSIWDAGSVLYALYADSTFCSYMPFVPRIPVNHAARNRMPMLEPNYIIVCPVSAFSNGATHGSLRRKHACPVLQESMSDTSPLNAAHLVFGVDWPWLVDRRPCETSHTQ